VDSPPSRHAEIVVVVRRHLVRRRDSDCNRQSSGTKRTALPSARAVRFEDAHQLFRIRDGSGRSRTALTTLKMAVLAPMPGRAQLATDAEAGRFETTCVCHSGCLAECSIFPSPLRKAIGPIRPIEVLSLVPQCQTSDRPSSPAVPGSDSRNGSTTSNTDHVRHPDHSLSSTQQAAEESSQRKTRRLLPRGVRPGLTRPPVFRISRTTSRDCAPSAMRIPFRRCAESRRN